MALMAALDAADRLTPASDDLSYSSQIQIFIEAVLEIIISEVNYISSFSPPPPTSATPSTTKRSFIPTGNRTCRRHVEIGLRIQSPYYQDATACSDGVVREGGDNECACEFVGS